MVVQRAGADRRVEEQAEAATILAQAATLCAQTATLCAHALRRQNICVTIAAVDALMKRGKALEQLKVRQTVWSCDARVMGCDFQTLSLC